MLLMLQIMLLSVIQYIVQYYHLPHPVVYGDQEVFNLASYLIHTNSFQMTSVQESLVRVQHTWQILEDPDTPVC